MAEEQEEVEGGPRSQMWKHEAMVSWINKEFDVDLDKMSAAEVIAYAFAHRVAWRKSDTYKSLVAERADVVAAEKAERQAEKEAEREAKKEAKAAEKAAKAAKAEKAPAAKATKAPAKKAAKSTKKGGKAASTSEDPFA